MLTLFFKCKKPLFKVISYFIYLSYDSPVTPPANLIKVYN